MNQSIANRQSETRIRSPFRSLLGRGLFEELFDQYLMDPEGESTQLMNVSMDVAETEQAFEVKVDLPGIEANDVDIQISNNTLTVRGTRSDTSEEKDEAKKFHRIERYQGSFSRSVLLPNMVNEDEAVAEFKGGVLKIVIPKSDEARPKKISIK